MKHRTVITGVGAPGFLGFLYRKFGTFPNVLLDNK